MADDHSGQEPVEELREGSERYRIITELVSDFAYCLNVASDGHLEHAWSTDTLERLTGQTLGYDYAAPEAERRAATDRWVEWWESSGESGRPSASGVGIAGTSEVSPGEAE